jgi:hypothetical protein
LVKGARVGRHHADVLKTGDPHYEDTATVVENYVYRGPDWLQPNGYVVKAGDWLVGMILTPQAWNLYKSGLIKGASAQGHGHYKGDHKRGQRSRPGQTVKGPNHAGLHAQLILPHDLPCFTGSARQARATAPLKGHLGA